MFKRLFCPVLFFFTASLLGLLQVYYTVAGNRIYLALAAFTYGLILGLVAQLCIRQPLPKVAIGVASFCGAFTLWLPAVLVTYGFALMATPLIVAYSLMVVLGISLSACVRKAKASEVLSSPAQ